MCSTAVDNVLNCWEQKKKSEGSDDNDMFDVCGEFALIGFLPEQGDSGQRKNQHETIL